MDMEIIVVMEDLMVIEAFILLMWFGNPMELKEYTVRDGLGDCLKAKRTIERTLRVVSLANIQVLFDWVVKN